jgi:hypothetical protein
MTTFEAPRSSFLVSSSTTWRPTSSNTCYWTA